MVQEMTALIKRRVLYIGSAVPMDTAAGLEAIQKPLLERYQTDPEKDLEGIDTNLTVTNSEITMQYVDPSAAVIQFPISSLTMCAAVRCIDTVNAATGESGPRFVSLNDLNSGGQNSTRPAIYTMITRRTQGRRLLECHGFICSSPRDAMDLVKWTKHAGENFKRSGGAQLPQNTRPNSGISTGPFQTSDFNQTSTMTRSVANVAPNGVDTEMRLIPGETIQQNIKAGPEFFEPVSKQGYFYSSNQAEVKKYNVHKLHREEDKENVEVPATEGTPRVANGYGPTIIRVGAAPPPLPPQQFVGRPPRMPYYPPPPPPMARPMYYAPPPPPPPIIVRPRFFSPPPPRVRPMPYMMPQPAPIFAPPLYVRRPRSASGSGSRSSSRGSRSKSPRQPTDVTGNTVPKVVPNGDADTSSEGTLTKRPDTPPTDYGKKSKGHRMSRRDQYEYRYRQEPPSQYPPMDDIPPQFMYDYYVYPPRHGGYEPFMMYNPHARSKSMPPRGRSSSPHKQGKKKHKKLKKKSKHSKPAKRPNYDRYGFSPRSDISTDSHTGYHSEIPARTRNPLDTDTGYHFYPPRDFRRNENQFMNERNFSKSIFEETRRSRDFKSYPTAYELNEQLGKSTKNEEVDFTMY